MKGLIVGIYGICAYFLGMYIGEHKIHKTTEYKKETYMAVPGDTLYVRGDTIIIKPYNK